MLALVGYIISHPSIITGQSNLFEGHSQYERFKKIFNSVVQTHIFEFDCLVISVGYFLTYPIRKGSVTFLAKGFTVSLPMALICLRVNWALGGVKDIYIKYMKSGYQFVGRSVSGLPILKKSSQCPLLTLIFIHVKIITRRKKTFPLK